MTSFIGYFGLAALALCWIPQSIDTIRKGTTSINHYFLMFSSMGSFSLMMYAHLQGDPIFFLLNSITTLGAILNLFFKFFPRKR